jgi:hypothetical protein
VDFKTIVTKGVDGGGRKVAGRDVTPASIWQNKAKNLSDFNVAPNVAPLLPFPPQMF